jgi:DNA repair protein RecO (recombination protein O)
MALVRSEGVVLKTHALGDTSRIVVVYTRDHGLVRLVAKGARKSPSRFGIALEPLSRSRFHFYFRNDRDLHLLSQADTLVATGVGMVDLTRLAHAQAALELIDRLVWGEEPHAELYDLLAQALDALTEAPESALAAVTIAFELQLAAMLGYRPRLDACAGCGAPLSQERLFSATRGGLMCAACAAREPGLVTLSADALGGIALLLSRPIGEAGGHLETRRTGEIQRVVEQFLRAHFHRFEGLRSLEVLRSLPGEAP